eukprot:CAMPEP_0172331174 /NCGR_PEP_ID=MMETSP1058-20130122/61790_1 /TAXON_ID=83371 /ORGANISM="Detonula confervacea, Strain CCMP 353" /LENGTH=350 /DNA_ID=CAMNT_0013048429 /DNA_START=524 /DNA_END=1573 /DNA_ORIENTATION=-
MANIGIMSSAYADHGNGSKLVEGIMSSTGLKTKQQKKEEGRQRALEISMAKQKISGNDALAENTNSKRGNRQSARHGARNQDRHKHFARWILERFPHVLEDCINAEVDDLNSCTVEATTTKKTTQLHILDVAGGKGELSARLSLCHSLRVVMIDPRPADIESVYMNSVVPKLPNKWQTSIQDNLQQSPTFVQDKLDKRFSQLIMPFTSPRASPTDEQLEDCYQDKTLDAAVRDASIVVGLHADGATDAIVDAALLYRKPFVVVPCCVFPNLFRERYISVPIDDATDGSGTSNRESVESQYSNNTPIEGNVLKEKRVVVRSHDQFCTYLLARDPRFVKEVLPFEGRNMAIW